MTGKLENINPSFVLKLHNVKLPSILQLELPTGEVVFISYDGFKSDPRGDGAPGRRYFPKIYTIWTPGFVKDGFQSNLDSVLKPMRADLKTFVEAVESGRLKFVTIEDGPPWVSKDV